MSDDPASDQALFVSLREGDDTALNRLIARWEKPLFTFAWRYMHSAADARDLVAETFVRLYQQRDRLRSDTKLAAWLFTALTNLCHNQHRWRRRHPTVSFQAATDEGTQFDEVLASDGPRPNTAIEREEAVTHLLRAIDQLPHDLKTTVLLHHYEGLSYRQIGDITGCSERGVETRLYRARLKLREQLGRYLRETASS